VPTRRSRYRFPAFPPPFPRGLVVPTSAVRARPKRAALMKPGPSKVVCASSSPASRTARSSRLDIKATSAGPPSPAAMGARNEKSTLRHLDRQRPARRADCRFIAEGGHRESQVRQLGAQAREGDPSRRPSPSRRTQYPRGRSSLRRRRRGFHYGGRTVQPLRSPASATAETCSFLVRAVRLDQGALVKSVGRHPKEKWQRRSRLLQAGRGRPSGRAQVPGEICS